MFTVEEKGILKELIEIEIDEIDRLIETAIDIDSLNKHRAKLKVILSKLD